MRIQRSQEVTFGKKNEKHHKNKKKIKKIQAFNTENKILIHRKGNKLQVIYGNQHDCFGKTLHSKHLTTKDVKKIAKSLNLHF